MTDYSRAESLSIDLRLEALVYVVDCVKRAYGTDAIALRNVAALVDGVADAVVGEDMQAAVVRGTRLLALHEVVHLVGLLRPR